MTEEKLLRDVMAIPKFFEEDIDDDEFWEGEDEKRHCSKGGEVEKTANWEGFFPTAEEVEYKKAVHEKEKLKGFWKNPEGVGCCPPVTQIELGSERDRLAKAWEEKKIIFGGGLAGCSCGHGEPKTVAEPCSAMMQKDEFESYRRDSCCEPVEFDEDDMTEIQVLIGLEINYIRGFLLEKNRKYGNSALEPIRVFSKADPIEQLRVRIDDKIKRITTCQADDEEDSILDLIGYLILLRIAKHQE